MRTRVCDELGIQYPIFAFSHSRAVVAAVSKAGGLGVMGAVAYSPDELEAELAWIDEHIDGRPYGVDVVMPVSSVAADGTVDPAALESMIPAGHKQFVENVLQEHRVPAMPEGERQLDGLLNWTPDRARRQVEIALAHPVKLLASALGPPPPDVIEQAHRQGMQVAALVGTAEQAQAQVALGVDIIVAQGTEAGGHTGEVATMVLVPQVVAAVAPAPVLAAGGIGSGAQAAAALTLGADGVWTGSIWLTTAESDSHPVVIEKLLAAGSRDTVRSRAMTGKPARQLRTAWVDAWDGPESPGALPMPLQFLLTSDAQSRMHRYAGDPATGAGKLVGSPVGQIVGSMQQVRPVDVVMTELVEGCRVAAERLSALSAER